MIKLPFLLIEGLKNVSILCTLHDDMMTFDLIIVIGMHRLSILEHHIIRDINNVVDRTDAGACETDLHPLRGWCKMNVLDHSCSITRAEISILDRNLQEVMNVFTVAGLLLLRHHEGLAEGCSSFTCDTKGTVAVYSI